MNNGYNNEKQLEHSKKWKKNNPDKVKEYQKQWREDNKEHIRVYQREWAYNKRMEQKQVDFINKTSYDL